MKELFLILATTLTLVSALPYLRDILKGTTKPNIVSWLTWTLLTGVATAAEIGAHEYVAALFTGAAVIETGAVVVLGLRYGYVRYTRFDVVCQIGAIVGLVVWRLFDSPALGVMASVAIDFVGSLPTLRHSWLRPQEETWQTYAISAFGGVFAVAALTSYNWVNLPYAVYIIGVNIVLVAIIVGRQRHGLRA